MAIYSLFVKNLEGKTLTFTFSQNSINGESIKNKIYAATRIPVPVQRLVAENRHIYSNTFLHASSSPPLFPTVHLLLRLVGGKGGFGSLLRGAGSKSGKKKTNNYDACRDLSGRRLRHVNAEKKLVEWQAEAEERRLEKIANDFIRKNAKNGKKVLEEAAEKYVAKYKEESAKCVAVVGDSVRESLEMYKNLKRKLPSVPESNSRRLKLWNGKKMLDDSDSEEDSEDENEESPEGESSDKSVILDNGNIFNSSTEPDRSTEPSCGLSDEASCKIISEEEHDTEQSKPHVEDEAAENKETPQLHLPYPNVGNTEELVEHDGSSSRAIEDITETMKDSRSVGGTSVPEEPLNFGQFQSATEMELNCSYPKAQNVKEMVVEHYGRSSTSTEDTMETRKVSEFDRRTLVAEKPLNFDEFQSATEMEGVGMEKLKAELLVRGLKCGGTLQERAARLFLLKTTPLEKLPKKLFVKKIS